MLHNSELNNLLLKIYDAISLTLKEGSAEDVAALYVALDGAKRELGEMHKQVETEVLQRMGDAPELHFDDGYVLEQKKGSPRKAWDHASLGEVVAQRLIDLSTDMETGELTRRPVDIAVDLLRFAAPSYWRVGELNKIGVNADMYCEVGEPKASIIIRKAS